MKKQLMKMKQMARQGDVLVINENSKSLKPETKERLFGNIQGKEYSFKKENRLALAYGEKTGHAHAIHEKDSAQLLVSSDIQETIKHLNVTGVATVTHEEHNPVEVAKGMNAVLIQNEYQQQKIRRVAD